jgi:hypothetical protein
MVGSVLFTARPKLGVPMADGLVVVVVDARVTLVTRDYIVVR